MRCLAGPTQPPLPAPMPPILVIGAYGDPPSASTFYQPLGIAVHASDNLWVSDTRTIVCYASRRPTQGRTWCWDRRI